MTAAPEKDVIDQIDQLEKDIQTPQAPAAEVIPNDPPAKAPAKPAAKKAAPKPAAKAPAKAPAKKAPGKAVAKVTPVIEGELPLDKTKAEALDKKIGTAVEGVKKAVGDADARIVKLTDLVNEAKAGQIHVALGFASWTAYFTERVQAPVVSLTERRNVIALLHDAGMSQRDIAKTVEVSPATVNATVQQLNASRPAKPAATTTTDKRGRIHSRDKASAAGKKAAGKKAPGKKADTGRATGKPPSQTTVTLGDTLAILTRANGSTFNEGQVKTLRAIKVQLDRVLNAVDTHANNNQTAKA